MFLKNILLNNIVIIPVNMWNVKHIGGIMSSFPERVRALRKERKLTQWNMATICGVQLRAYQAYEYNQSYPDVPGLLRLADFFDVSLDYLMGRSDVREVQKPSELSEKECKS